MKNRLISGIFFIILGLLIGLGPIILFPVCRVHTTIMDCFWTARTELGIGILTGIFGIFLIIFPSVQLRIGLSISLVSNGILGLLVPDILIGVCDGKHMSCRLLTLPALNILNMAVIIAAAVNGLSLYQTDKRNKEMKKRQVEP